MTRLARQIEHLMDLCSKVSLEGAKEVEPPAIAEPNDHTGVGWVAYKVVVIEDRMYQITLEPLSD